MPPCPHHLVSVIPTQYPDNAYHTWVGHSGVGRSGLDCIHTAAEHIDTACTCGIDHEITTKYLTSDHYLIYATFTLSCLNTTPTPPHTKLFHYRQVAHIPLVNTYQNKLNNYKPQWYAPQTFDILPNDVQTYAKMHDVLNMEHDNPKVQHHLQQAS